MSAVIKFPARLPDLPSGWAYQPRKLYDRERFRVGDKLFTRTEPGEYSDGRITVYCDQQDSTAWAARLGDLHTGYHWTHEGAVMALLQALED